MPAFDNLVPHTNYIVTQRQSGKTLTTIADLLANEQLASTTAGTLSRFLKEVGNPDAPPAPPATKEQDDMIEVLGLLVELTASEAGHANEQRVVIEHLAGKIAGMGERITQLEESLPDAPVQSSAWPLIIGVSLGWIAFSAASLAGLWFYLAT